VAQQMAQMGANLVLISTNLERLEQLQQSLSLPDERVLTYAVDLVDGESTHAAAQAVLKKFSRLDILLHLVGGWTGGKSVIQAPAVEVQNMLDQHVWTTFNVVQAFVPSMLTAGWGRVVAISTPFAARPGVHGAPYALAKAAQESLLLSLAQELKDKGVTTNLIVVRAIDVNHERLQERTAQNASWATPEEIASLILYLCSEEAHMVNGARIPVQGSYI
jgi:NAD(P)-dependent dehydrogenase (short-subunit alcohol dehydrogenase family)